MEESFWQEQNGWWKSAGSRISAGTAGTEDWEAASLRLWSLSFSIPEGKALRVHDRQDLVQTTLVRLQDQNLLKRLEEVETPAHYLCRVMQNHLRNERRRERAAQRVYAGHAELTATCEDQRPVELALRKEESARVHFIVQHLLAADDRKILWWYYRDGFAIEVIAGRMKISKTAAWQRLARARHRLKEQLKE